ncbi:MAG: ComF family protein [candidate division WOR-3 bacterium]|nr:ComF family protein [candidate division WOR-3 bacterium]
MLRILQNIADFIFPPFCAICGNDLDGEKVVCKECFGKVHFVSNSQCRICGKPIKSGTICKSCRENLPSFNFVIGCGSYVPPLSNIIKLYKYNRRPSLSERLARLLYSSYQTRGDVKGIKLVTWVPMRRAKIRERGYNQSRILAREFTFIAGLKSVKLLRKVKNIQSQTKLSSCERLVNVQGAFRVDYEILNALDSDLKKEVILIDDVLTTGATLNECSKVLKKAGFSRVIGLVSAISP